MSLFRKQYTPEQLGAIIYESLRHYLTGEENLSIVALVESLGYTGGELDEQYIGEIMVGCMFAAMLAVERSVPLWVGSDVKNGMQHEFFVHLREQGASPEQIREWEAILLLRFEEYQRCLQNYEGFEPPWKLGRQFYWNVTGSSDYIAMNIKIATLYLLAMRDAIQKTVNDLGPRLITKRLV